jgi:hypothetical protein
VLMLLLTLTALCAAPGLHSAPYAVAVQADTSGSYATTWVIPRNVCPQAELAPKPKKHKRTPRR